MWSIEGAKPICCIDQYIFSLSFVPVKGKGISHKINLKMVLPIVNGLPRLVARAKISGLRYTVYAYE